MNDATAPAEAPAVPKIAEDTPKSPAEEEDITLYLGTITSIGSIFNALRHFIISLQNFPWYVRFAYQMNNRKLGGALDYVVSKRDDNASTANTVASESSRNQVKPRLGKIRRMINVNKCATKKRRRKLKLHLFKCEHLAKLLLLEAYASTETEEEFFQTITLEEGLGIGRLMLKMIKHNEQGAVDELGQRTVDFMKHSIVAIENHYIRNDLKM